MTAIRGLEQRLDDREEELLEIARRRARLLARLSELTSVLGSAATFVIILVATVQIHTLLRTRERLNGETSRLTAGFSVTSRTQFRRWCGE